jgi:hypothetical protein
MRRLAEADATVDSGGGGRSRFWDGSQRCNEYVIYFSLFKTLITIDFGDS